MTLESIENELWTLFAKAQQGDQGAYKRLLERMATLVRAYLRRRLTGQDGDVEDLVQDVLLAVHTKRHTYDTSQPLTAWMHAIARYKLIDFWRRVGRLNEQGLSDEDESALVGESSIDAFEAKRDLQAVMAQLSSQQREVIMLVKFQGISVAEAAVQLNMTESAVKVNTHRGLRKLASLLGRTYEHQ
jgi:RNA polymerase sigma factor (sigma-70 family)